MADPASGPRSRARMVRLILSLLLVSATSASFAKCLMPTITVSGTVTDLRGKPVAGAGVAVAWTLRGQPGGQAQAVTDAGGAYVVSFTFNTYTRTSKFRGDVCKGSVKQVSVSASAVSGESAPALVPVVALTARADLVLLPIPQ